MLFLDSVHMLPEIDLKLVQFGLIDTSTITSSFAFSKDSKNVGVHLLDTIPNPDAIISKNL